MVKCRSAVVVCAAPEWRRPVAAGKRSSWREGWRALRGLDAACLSLYRLKRNGEREISRAE